MPLYGRERKAGNFIDNDQFDLNLFIYNQDALTTCVFEALANASPRLWHERQHGDECRE